MPTRRSVQLSTTQTIEDEYTAKMHTRNQLFYGKKPPERDPTKGTTQVLFGEHQEHEPHELDTARLLEALAAASFQAPPFPRAHTVPLYSV
jgi:hypothetical protein